MGDAEDRARLEQMTEKEREQELFNRIEKREVLKRRWVVMMRERRSKNLAVENTKSCGQRNGTKTKKQQFWKTLLVNFPRFTTTIRKHAYGRLWHFSNPLCAFNYSRLRLSVLTDLKLRRSWRRQRRRRKRRRKRSRRKSKKKGSYLRFKTHKWWVWGLFEQY